MKNLVIQNLKKFCIIYLKREKIDSRKSIFFFVQEKKKDLLQVYYNYITTILKVLTFC